MKVGDLVRETDGTRVGFVERVDRAFYGATQAFKIYADVPRGRAIRSNMVDGIGPTKNGIRDRVLVCWTDGHPEYRVCVELEVISAGR